MDDKGKVIADAVIQRLGEDGFFPGCRAAQDPSMKQAETADSSRQ
jgi:hypothetical protein